MENENRESGTSTSTDLSPTPEQVIEHKMAEEGRISRFFSKLLSEVLSFQADSVEFNKAGAALSVTIRRGADTVKGISARAAWFEPICNWLSKHYNRTIKEPQGYIDHRSEGEMFCSFRVDDRAVSFRTVKISNLKGETALILSDFSALPIARVIEGVGISSYTRSTFESLTSIKTGAVIVTAPERQLEDALSMMRSMTGWEYAGELSSSAVRSIAERIAVERPVIVSCRNSDISDLLIELRKYGEAWSSSLLQGILCLGFAKKVCDVCARKSAIDSGLFGKLPEHLQRTKIEHYMIGRGCDQCGDTGYRGSIAVLSVVKTTEEVRALISNPAGEGAAVQMLYPRGVKPLLEDGLLKAAQGWTTLEAVFELTKGVPQAYTELWKQTGVFTSQKYQSNNHETNSTKPPTRREPTYRPLKPAVERNNPRLLIVEDDADQRSILELVFKQANYEVIQAANGVEGLECVEREQPDLIISDLMMPQMDGSEFVTRLKNNPRYHRIPILMLTVIADEEREYALLDMGADDYCEKTIQRKLLLKRIERLLTRTYGNVWSEAEAAVTRN